MNKVLENHQCRKCKKCPFYWYDGYYSESGRVQVQFSLQQFEIDLIKELAEKEGLNKSRFLMQCINFWKENH